MIDISATKVWSEFNKFANAFHDEFNEHHPELTFPCFCDTDAGERIEELISELWEEGYGIAIAAEEDDG